MGFARALHMPPRKIAEAAVAKLPETLPAGASADRSVILTFTGDCTLGSEEAKRAGGSSFDSVVGREGFSYPFEKIT